MREENSIHHQPLYEFVQQQQQQQQQSKQSQQLKEKIQKKLQSTRQKSTLCNKDTVTASLGYYSSVERLISK